LLSDFPLVQQQRFIAVTRFESHTILHTIIKSAGFVMHEPIGCDGRTQCRSADSTLADPD
jgi:hypothetical protein